jgi:hypothetical protein
MSLPPKNLSARVQQEYSKSINCSDMKDKKKEEA